MNRLAPESTHSAPPQPFGRSAAAGADSRGERRPDVGLPPIQFVRATGMGDTAIAVNTAAAP
eukprot:2838730-Pyramimonas_sp.AAC.1